jgi:hypothetical protein
MMDKAREEFEAWAISSAWLGLSAECLEFFEGGYVQGETQAAWLGWQASRSVLVVVLPRPRLTYSAQEASSDQDYYLDGAHDDALYACRQALEAVGIPAKP